MYKKLLIATDGSDTATKAARRGGELAKMLGAEAIVLHVGEDERGREVLKHAQSMLGDGFTYRTVPGEASEMILQIAEEEGCDLIVVGNKGMTGARRFLLGSVPNQVSHHARTNVFIVKTT